MIRKIPHYSLYQFYEALQIENALSTYFSEMWSVIVFHLEDGKWIDIDMVSLSCN
jgi:hypothetical protein